MCQTGHWLPLSWNQRTYARPRLHDPILCEAHLSTQNSTKKPHWSHSLCPTQCPHNLSREQASQQLPKCLKVPVSHLASFSLLIIKCRKVLQLIKASLLRGRQEKRVRTEQPQRSWTKCVPGGEIQLVSKGLCNTDQAPQFPEISVPSRPSFLVACQTQAWNKSTIPPSQPPALPQQQTVHRYYGSTVTETLSWCLLSSQVPRYRQQARNKAEKYRKG